MRAVHLAARLGRKTKRLNAEVAEDAKKDMGRGRSYSKSR